MKKVYALDSDLIVPADGGTISAGFPGDEETSWETTLPPGVVDLKPYAKLLAPGEELRFSGGLVPVRRSTGRQRPLVNGERELKSGANPDWRPTKLDAVQKEMRKGLQKLARMNKSLDAKISSAAKAAEAGKKAAEADAAAEAEEKAADAALSEAKNKAKEERQKAEQQDAD